MSVWYYPIFIENWTVLDILHFNMMTALNHDDTWNLANTSYNQSVEFLINTYMLVHEHLQHIPNLPYEQQNIYIESFVTTTSRYQLQSVFRDLMMWKIYEDWWRFRYDHNYDLWQYYNTFSTFKAQHNYWLWWKYFIRYESDLTPILTNTEDCLFKFRRNKYLLRPVPQLTKPLFVSEFTTLRQKTYYDYQDWPGLYWASNYYWYKNTGYRFHLVGDDGFKIYWYEHFGSAEVLIKILYSYFWQWGLPEGLIVAGDPDMARKFFIPSEEVQMTRYWYDIYKPKELYFLGPRYHFFRYVQRSLRREMFDRAPFDFDSF